MKKATHQVRKEQAEIVAVVQQGLESMQVIEAFGRQDMEQEALAEVSQATVNAALKARKVKSLLSPIVTIATAFMYCHRLVAGCRTHPARRDDHRRADCLSLLPLTSSSSQ